MCDLDVGDDVVMIVSGGEPSPTGEPPIGWRGRVTAIYPGFDPRWPEIVGLDIDTWPLPGCHKHNHQCWRKVERGGGAEWDRVATRPAKKRERA